RARMITAIVFVPWEPNSASTAWMSEAVRTTRGDWGAAVPDEADPDGACAGAGGVCAESARLSVEVTVDQYGLGPGSGLARPSQFVTGGLCQRSEATGVGGRSVSGESFELDAALLRQQEHGEELNDIDGRQQCQGEAEAERTGQQCDDDGGRSADGAAEVEDDGLRRGPDLGGIHPGQQRAVPSEHAVGEGPHEQAAEQQGGRVGHLTVDEDRDGRSGLEDREGGTAPEPIGQLSEDEDAGEH